MAGGSATSSDRNTAFAHLIDPSRTWYSNRRLIILHAWLVLLLITSSTNGYDGSLLNSFQSMPLWNDYFNQPQGPTLGLLTAIQNIGSLAGYPFAPYLSDGIGRRPTIWIGALVMLVGVAVQSASHNIGTFIGARFLIGFGLTFAANAAPMLVVEISYPPYRAPLTSLYNSLWYSGNIIASWTSFGTSKINNEWCWRIPPRYLVAAGKEKAALHTLAYYHADGNENDALVQYEFEEIKTAIRLDREASKNVGWKALFNTPGNRKRMVIIVAIAWFSQWSGNGLVSYYLNKVFDTIGITDTSIQLVITGCLAIWNLIWAVAASFMVDRLGRRFLFLTSAGG
ncbi:Lactose permease [Grifola frondosa]|uniref:Lactose permease n=1 Tax=Grifola frondosa TaxID=5627 RepID=A0A1C7LRQ8_GRIFR|nr:Lactose permease [Grifola frondosa]